MSDTYGISHNDTDMSSSEELSDVCEQKAKREPRISVMLVTDSQDRLYLKILFRVTRPPIGIVFLIGQRAKMVKWMVAYTGVTTFLVNTDQLIKCRHHGRISKTATTKLPLDL